MAQAEAALAGAAQAEAAQAEAAPAEAALAEEAQAGAAQAVAAQAVAAQLAQQWARVGGMWLDGRLTMASWLLRVMGFSNAVLCVRMWDLCVA